MLNQCSTKHNTAGMDWLLVALSLDLCTKIIAL